MHRRQVFVSITQMVLAELTGGIAMRLEKLGDCRILRTHSHRCAGHAHLAQSGAEHALTHDESSTARGTALLSIAIRKQHAFMSNAVDIGSLVAHHAAAVAAEVPIPDVISPNDENVWLAVRHGLSPLLGVRRNAEAHRRTQ